MGFMGDHSTFLPDFLPAKTTLIMFYFFVPQLENVPFLWVLEKSERV